MFSKKGMKLF